MTGGSRQYDWKPVCLPAELWRGYDMPSGSGTIPGPLIYYSICNRVIWPCLPIIRLCSTTLPYTAYTCRSNLLLFASHLPDVIILCVWRDSGGVT